MKRLLGFAIMPFLFVSLFSEGEAKKESSPEPFLNEKHFVKIREIGGELSVSGEVRTEMQATHEDKNGARVRGRGGLTKRPTVAYDVEFNLMMDYRAERAWASVKLEFDNDMGIVNGTVNKISLERAYLGGRLVPGETFIMDAELGRRFLYAVFDSKIEFASFFDGLLLKFNKSFEKIGNFYVNGGPFIVYDRKNHYGFVGELGILAIGNTGCYLKYSIIDWKKHYNKPLVNLAFNYIDSQLIIGYEGEIPRLKNNYFKVYLAGLVNHAAKRLPITNHKKEKFGGYVGFSIGKFRKKGDWALDLNYQVVMAQAVPDFDSNGIKRGNAENIGFYSFERFGRGRATLIEEAVGGGNYRGWAIDLLYGLTDNLTLFQNFQMSRTLNTDIGPLIKYCQYEMEFIYSF